MKRIMTVLICALISLVSIACTKQIREIDLTAKGVVKCNFIVTEENSASKFRPSRVYFKKLENSGDLMKGKIIASEVTDDDGNFMINYEPGIYVVVAVVRASSDSKIVDIFNEAAIKKTMAEIKAGDNVNIGDISVLENSANLFGKIEQIQDYHHDAIGGDLSTMIYSYRLVSLDPKYKDKKITEKDKEEPAKVEVYK
ncbi:MAG TPA: hypothetical protein VF857_02110 [Spirochaetota bacterium]